MALDLNYELRSISRSAVSPIPELAPLPKKAIAVDATGTWVLLISGRRARCANCDGSIVPGRKVVWSRRTRENRCTRCIAARLVLTPYGQRRRRAYRGRTQQNLVMR